jgi:hypothetical protein
MALGEFWVIFITSSQLKWSHKKSYENFALKELNYLLYPNNTFQHFIEVSVMLNSTTKVTFFRWISKY